MREGREVKCSQTDMVALHLDTQMYLTILACWEM